MRHKHARIAEIRPVQPEDGEVAARYGWVAFDTAGRRFVDYTEEGARKVAEAYNNPNPEVWHAYCAALKRE